MAGPLKSHFAAAVVGGLLVAGGLLVTGVAGSRSTQTVVEEAPVSAQASASASGLTAHDIYQRDAPGVVYVQARLVDQVQSPFDLFHSRESAVSTGSGFLVDRRGDILTNYHVIEGADRSTGVTVSFENSIVRAASVVAVDASDDLAVLRVDTRRLPAVLPLRLGDSTSVRVGDPTLAIGNPFGVDRTLSSGIISALQHQIQAVDGRTIDNVIQTDEPLLAGNSGGPLLDAQGRVIGVNSQITASGGAGAQRLEFAIPIDTAYAVLGRVARQQSIQVAYLGVGAASAAGTRLAGTVGKVASGGPANQGGVQPGDVIERVDGIPADSISDVLAVISTFSPGQTVSLQIRRDHHRRTIAVTLGSRRVPTPDG
ncbi:MAG: trypsin-like peptidase domain-containing protein [Solirubrobacteraceae bacterium]